MSFSNIISPISNSVRTAYNKMPSLVLGEGNVLNNVEKIGRKWTSPQQRLIQGATAIVMQPIIDARNKNVDDETRKVSIARTCAKIIAGTLTGFAIRYACIKGIAAMSKPLSAVAKDASPFKKKFQTFLTPSNLIDGDKDLLDQYRNAMGTIWSLVIMMFTNFLIDAPLTRFLTNKFNDMRKAHEASGEKGAVK